MAMEKNDEYKIYCFYWNEGFGDEMPEGVYLQIKAEEEVVKKLLDEYRNEYPDTYNMADWLDFLTEHNIEWKEVKFIDIEF